LILFTKRKKELDRHREIIELKFNRVFTVLISVIILASLTEMFSIHSKSTCFLFTPWRPYSRRISAEGGGLFDGAIIGVQKRSLWEFLYKLSIKSISLLNSQIQTAFWWLVVKFLILQKQMSLQFVVKYIKMAMQFCKNIVEIFGGSFRVLFWRALEKNSRLALISVDYGIIFLSTCSVLS
jgi:hypothetical protein